MKSHRLLIIALYVCVALTSCSIATPTPIPKPTVNISAIQTKAARDTIATITASVPTLTPTLTNPDLLYFDDFSDTRSGWQISDDISGTRRYYNGEYFVKIKDDKYLYFNEIYGQEFEDFVLNIDLRKISGDDDVSFADIVWRSQSNSNYYLLSISDAGNYKIFKAEGQGYKELSSFIDCTEMYNSGEINRITVAVHGDKFDIFINEKFTGTYVDSSFASGEIAFGVSTYKGSIDQPEFAFDNLTIYRYDVTNAFTPIKP